MLLIRAQYKTLWKAGECICVPLRKKYGLFHFPEPVEIRIGDTLCITKPNAVILSSPDEPRWFNFSRDTRFNFFHAHMGIEELIEKYEIPMNCILYPQNPEFLNSGFQRLRMEYLSHERNAGDMQDIYIRELLIKLSRDLHDPRNMPEGKMQKRLRELRLEMLSQPEKKWNVPDMAKTLSLSPSRFHVVYRRMFGTTPAKDLIAARVDRAKVLLLEDQYDNLAGLAEKLGYKNPYDFSRQFKQLTGIAPGAYRKKNP